MGSAVGPSHLLLNVSSLRLSSSHYYSRTVDVPQYSLRWGLLHLDPAWLCLTDELKQHQMIPLPPVSSQSNPRSHSTTVVIFPKWAPDSVIALMKPFRGFLFPSGSSPNSVNKTTWQVHVWIGVWRASVCRGMVGGPLSAAFPEWLTPVVIPDLGFKEWNRVHLVGGDWEMHSGWKEPLV